MTTTTLAKAIADAARRSNTPGPLANPDLHKKVPAYVAFLEREFLPSGSGFNNGTRIDLDACTESKLVFTTSFHHTDEGGSYDGWTDHKVTVLATFGDHLIKVTGRNRNEIKDYIADYFYSPMSLEVLTFWHWATDY